MTSKETIQAGSQWTIQMKISWFQKMSKSQMSSKDHFRRRKRWVEWTAMRRLWLVEETQPICVPKTGGKNPDTRKSALESALEEEGADVEALMLDPSNFAYIKQKFHQLRYQELDDKKWVKRSCLERVFYVLNFPFDLARDLTIPPVEKADYHKPMLVA